VSVPKESDADCESSVGARYRFGDDARSSIPLNDLYHPGIAVFAGEYQPFRESIELAIKVLPTLPTFLFNLASTQSDFASEN
jgi:hypothetical protein